MKLLKRKIVCSSALTLYRNKRFSLNKIFQWNASKYVYEKPRWYFFFVSHFIQLYLLHYECWHRSGVTFIREKMHEMRNEKKLGGFSNK